MTLEEWNDRRLDDLAQQVRVVAALTAQVVTHDAKIDGLEDDVERGRRSIAETADQFQRALEAFDKSCDAKVSRLERALQKHEDSTAKESVKREAAEKELRDEIGELAKASRWTPTQWVAIIGPGILTGGGILIALITGQSPS